LFYTSVDSFAADAVILAGSALHAAFIVIGLLALSSGLEGVPGHKPKAEWNAIMARIRTD
jgi:hypothetical protein